MDRLQRADKLVGALACALLQPLRWWRSAALGLGRRRPPEPRRILLVKFWGLGSLQLLTPAARCLRARHPGAEIALLTLRGNREGAQALGVFDTVVTLDVDGAGWLGLFGRVLRLIASLRRARFDAVYDFEFFTRFSALVSVLAGAPETHGFAASKVWRGRFHTTRVPFNRYWHVARNFRVLAGDDDTGPVHPAELAPLQWQEADERRLERALSFAGLDPGGPIAVLNPNAGELSLERRWPRPFFAELALRLGREDGLQVALVGARRERAWTEGVADLARASAPAPFALGNLAGELSLRELGALLARAEVFVSNDSGPMHLGAALGAPTVGLFGPETPVMYRPLGLRAVALYDPPPCSPCINVHDNKVANCVHGRPECLVRLDVGRVLDAARALRAGPTLSPAPPPAPSPERPGRLTVLGP